VLGVALGSREGTAGTTFYVVHHITIQTALFLVLGLVERRAGSTALMRIGGLARIAPLLAVLFFIPAMNLAGIPPFSGFIGKVGLFQAAQSDGSALAWTLVAGGALTSLLTLYAVSKTWAVAFWRSPKEAHEALEAIGATDDPDGEPVPGHDTRAVHEHRGHVHTAGGTVSRADIEQARRLGDDDMPDRDFYTLIEAGEDNRHSPGGMLAPAAALVTLSVLLSVVAGPLYAFCDRAATDLHDREPYLTSVLTGEDR
jgi:multicomponent Na+:H+ antiporter subunit D